MARPKKKTESENPDAPKVLTFKLDPIKNAFPSTEAQRVKLDPFIVPPQRNVWPESVELRSLEVHLSEAERSQAASKMADLLVEIDEKKTAAKQAAKNAKGVIQSLEIDLAMCGALVQKGVEARQGPCVWIFEYAGKDKEDAWIPNPDMKTLVRQDNWKVVTVERITTDERQTTMNLPVEDAPAPVPQISPELMEAFITENGYELKESGHADAPFVIQGPTGLFNIAADSRAKALPHAYAWLDLVLNPVEETVDNVMIGGEADDESVTDETAAEDIQQPDTAEVEE